jgi:hypothetical protein
MRVEKDNSGRAACKKCGKLIPKGTLRLIDDSDWQKFKGQARGTEGASRGYVELGGSRVVSREGKKYHLACANRKIQRETARGTSLKGVDREEFERWQRGEKLAKPVSKKPTRRLTALEKSEAAARQRRKEKRLAKVREAE